MWSGLADIDGLSGKELAPPHESVGQSLLHCRKVGQPEGIEQIGHPWRQGVQDLLKIVSEIQQLAVALNIDPIELRLRNEPERDEFKNLPFSSRSTRECYRAAAERFGWNRRNPQPRSMRDGRWLIGWGDGDRDLSHELCAGFCNGALAARRHGRGDERIQRHGGRAPGPP